MNNIKLFKYGGSWWMEIFKVKFISKFICRFKRGKEILTILDVYFGGARAVLGKQGNNYELTICYKGRYFVQQIKSKYRTEEVIDIAAEEVKKFIKSKSLFSRIKKDVSKRK